MKEIIADLFPETKFDPTIDVNTRLTLRATDQWCRQRARVSKWDLDVAASDKFHLADRWFTKEQNGLEQEWNADAVWCNPPYDVLEPWFMKAWREVLMLRARLVAILIPGDRPEQPFWQHWVEPYRDGSDYPHPGFWNLQIAAKERVDDRIRMRTSYPPGRQKFGHEGDPLGLNVGSPGWPSVLVVIERLP